MPSVTVLAVEVGTVRVPTGRGVNRRQEESEIEHHTSSHNRCSIINKTSTIT
jgi:hypothetical protein